ncbi:MAG: hypothetical protein MJ184_01775 [Treponema sp.]|uniref:hypothetical protein n=1 Tax=Treponema sp. TaxID=166 RepID=UPI00298E2589|nr:hypothetical protein [Treponema sp.]MCQ2600075.1 hypothetical protein [Treponema sp.]
MKNIIYLVFAACLILFAGCESTTVEKSEAPVKPSVQKPAKTEAELEYERATQDLDGEKISIETYEMDKKIILEKISELNIIMKDKNYKSWLNYIEKSSIDYWSMKTNLSAVSKQLPVKGLNLKTLEDYFNYVFIPSRMGRRIDEIRYLSSTSIKAVQIRNDDTIVFYNFKKIDDQWQVELPRL